jgi:hypothetical protein
MYDGFRIGALIFNNKFFCVINVSLGQKKKTPIFLQRPFGYDLDVLLYIHFLLVI